MALRFAFAGFRHPHILSVHALARQTDGLEVVAACEADPAARADLAAGGRVEVTHESVDAMFAEADFDVLAVGDCYGRRGALLIRALEAGKHVLSDKPICTSPAELDRIAGLAGAGGLSVGCQLDLRDSGAFRALREVVRGGRIGEVHTIDFQGQHPLMPDRRPAWYFRPGLHGGTINDLAIHAVDAIPWLTGRRIVEVVAARAWNARADCAFFQDGAQMMFRLDNDGGVLGDVSYLTPDNFAYKVPCYWRFTIHGSGGVAETAQGADGVTVYAASDDAPRHVDPAPARTDGYLRDFLAEIAGQEPRDGALTTDAVLAAARVTLLAQHAADHGLRDVAV